VVFVGDGRGEVDDGADGHGGTGVVGVVKVGGGNSRVKVGSGSVGVVAVGDGMRL